MLIVNRGHVLTVVRMFCNSRQLEERHRIFANEDSNCRQNIKRANRYKVLIREVKHTTESTLKAAHATVAVTE